MCCPFTRKLVLHHQRVDNDCDETERGKEAAQHGQAERPAEHIRVPVGHPGTIQTNHHSEDRHRRTDAHRCNAPDTVYMLNVVYIMMMRHLMRQMQDRSWQLPPREAGGDHWDVLVLHGWKPFSRIWNPATSIWTTQLTWLKTVHSGDWCLRSALRTISGACQKWWWWYIIGHGNPPQKLKRAVCRIRPHSATGLPNDTGKRATTLTTVKQQADTHFPYWDGRLSWPWCWLYTELVYLSTDCHPSGPSSKLVTAPKFFIPPHSPGLQEHNKKPNSKQKSQTQKIIPNISLWAVFELLEG